MIDDHSREGASGFGARLKTAMGDMPQNLLAQRADVTKSTLSRILQGQEPRLDEAVRLAKEVKADLMWLATGRGVPGTEAGFVNVPIYDVRLAAGVAAFTDAAEQIGMMPFDRELLRGLGRSSHDSLAVFLAEGDSMWPTVQDGARVLTDLKDTRLREGVFAFRTGDELRIKRLRRLVDGIEIRSDNDRYPPEILKGEDADEVAIIGAVLWTGNVL